MLLGQKGIFRLIFSAANNILLLDVPFRQMTPTFINKIFILDEIDIFHTNRVVNYLFVPNCTRQSFFLKMCFNDKETKDNKLWILLGCL